jgi:hypothetical protein
MRMYITGRGIKAIHIPLKACLYPQNSFSGVDLHLPILNVPEVNPKNLGKTTSRACRSWYFRIGHVEPHTIPL